MCQAPIPPLARVHAFCVFPLPDNSPLRTSLNNWFPLAFGGEIPRIQMSPFEHRAGKKTCSRNIGQQRQALIHPYKGQTAAAEIGMPK
jgi:hypothetical protein